MEVESCPTVLSKLICALGSSLTLPISNGGSNRHFYHQISLFCDKFLTNNKVHIYFGCSGKDSCYVSWNALSTGFAGDMLKTDLTKSYVYFYNSSIHLGNVRFLSEA